MEEFWRREGLVLTPPSHHAWWKSHAQAPTVLKIDARLWRIYFAARDGENRSHIISVDVEPDENMRVVAQNHDPILQLGPPGSFDHSGMGPATALFVGSEIHLYYTGFSLRRDVPYQTAIGLAISADGGSTFRRASAGPLLSAGPYDPFFVSTPCVRQAGDGLQMWYLSGIKWQRIVGEFEAFYNVHHAYSPDGMHWTCAEKPALDLGLGEAGIGRAWICQSKIGLGMWVCIRGPSDFRRPSAKAYKLRRTSAIAGDHWNSRTDPLSFANPASSEDWDSWMQAYPCVVPHRSDLILFYNGNGFGRAGFGYARLVGGA
jgi:hypothetical protein